MGKRKRRRNKKKRDEQNLLIIIIAIIAVIILVVAYLTWRKKTAEPPEAQEIEPSVDPRLIRLAELGQERENIQFKKYQVYQKLCEFNVIERWCKEKIDGIFKFGRWLLFLIVLAGFIITWSESLNFLGWTTSDFLKGVNAIGVLIFLLYFASSDANDSLMKCYHNSKAVAVRIFMKLIYWYYKKFHKIHKDNREELKKSLKTLYLELKPVIDEIRDLKNSLLNDNPNTTNLLN